MHKALVVRAVCIACSAWRVFGVGCVCGAQGARRCCCRLHAFLVAVRARMRWCKREEERGRASERDEGLLRCENVSEERARKRKGAEGSGDATVVRSRVCVCVLVRVDLMADEVYEGERERRD